MRMKKYFTALKAHALLGLLPGSVNQQTILVLIFPSLGFGSLYEEWQRSSIFMA